MTEDRIHCIDILRGFAIILMIIAHFFKYWMAKSYYYILGVYFVSLDPMGTPGFVFVSGMAFAFTWRKDLTKNMSKKEFLYKNLSRTVVLGILAFGYNLLAVIISGMQWELLWFWFILQCLFFCRVFATGLMRTPAWTRGILSIVIISITPILLSALESSRDINTIASIIYYLLFNPLFANGILFYFPFFLIGTIIGDNIFLIKSMKSDDGLVRKMLTQLVAFGIAYIMIAILLGAHLVAEDFGYNALDYINTGGHLNWSGIPLFLVTNSYAFILYAIGWHLLLTALFFYLADLRIKKDRSRWKIELFGQYSLTIYLGHYLLFIKNPQFEGIWIWIGLIFFVCFIWIIVYLLDRFTEGRYTLENIMNLSAEYIFRRWMHKEAKGLWKNAFQLPKKPPIETNNRV